MRGLRNKFYKTYNTRRQWIWFYTSPFVILSDIALTIVSTIQYIDSIQNYFLQKFEQMSEKEKQKFRKCEFYEKYFCKIFSDSENKICHPLEIQSLPGSGVKPLWPLWSLTPYPKYFCNSLSKKSLRVIGINPPGVKFLRSGTWYSPRTCVVVKDPPPREYFVQVWGGISN